MSSRRSFLRDTVSAGALALMPNAARAIDPIRRASGPRMKLSLAAYSFRDYLAGKDKSMTYEEFVELAAGYDLDAIEPTSYYFPEGVTPGYLRGFRRRAFLLGLDISGTAIGNDFTHPPGPQLDKEVAHTRKWIDNAVALGAPVIRIFAGNLQNGTTEDQARRWCTEAIQKCCDYAAERGVLLALENHGGIVTTAGQVLSIVREINSEWFGVNLDTGNFRGPDPYDELARVAPYAVTVQVKTEISAQGEPRKEADLERVVGILRKAGYRGYIALEYEAREDPKTAVPRHLRTLRKLIT